MENLKRDVRADLERMGAVIYENCIPAFREKNLECMKNTYYTLGQGFKVAVEVVAMAASKGAVKSGEDVIGVGGDGRGGRYGANREGRTSRRYIGKGYQEAIGDTRVYRHASRQKMVVGTGSRDERAESFDRLRLSNRQHRANGNGSFRGRQAKRVNVEVKRADECSLGDLEGADGIILGSPTHFGTMSERMKKLIDESVKIRGKLESKVGAAFTSSRSIGGGNETTLISLIQAMLIHGMIVVGDPMEATGHYGAVAIGEPDEEALDTCRKLGKRVGGLVKKLP